MITTELLHPLQLQILEQLRLATDSLRYSQMRPVEVENDLYNYHLQQLVKNKFIQKRKSEYLLTITGKKYLMELQPYEAQTGTIHKFKVAALALVVRRTGSKVLVLYQIRKREPSRGVVEIVGGGIRRGELATDAARRRLKEETGLSAIFSPLGSIRKIRFDQNGSLYSDIWYQICGTESSTGTLQQENNFGQNVWLDLDEAIRIEKQSKYGSKELAVQLTKLRSKTIDNLSCFFSEETYSGNLG